MKGVVPASPPPRRCGGRARSGTIGLKWPNLTDVPRECRQIHHKKAYGTLQLLIAIATRKAHLSGKPVFHDVLLGVQTSAMHAEDGILAMRPLTT